MVAVARARVSLKGRISGGRPIGGLAIGTLAGVPSSPVKLSPLATAFMPLFVLLWMALHRLKCLGRSRDNRACASVVSRIMISKETQWEGPASGSTTGLCELFYVPGFLIVLHTLT